MNTNIDQGTVTIPDANKACVICRAKNKETAAECAASLALCENKPLFTTVCEGLCLPHRRLVVRALASVVRDRMSQPYVSLDTLPQGDPRALALQLRECDFLEVVELYLRIIEANGIVQNTEVHEDSIKSMRRHVLGRREQEKNNPQWENAFADHVASEVRNARVLLKSLEWRLTPARAAKVKELWAATWQPG